MAIITPTTTVIHVSPYSLLVTWAGLANGDTGQPFETRYGPYSIWIDVGGTFGTGGSVSFQGSNTDVYWQNMIMVNNSAATFTGTSSAGIRGSPRFIRPNVTAGDVNTNLTLNAYLVFGSSMG